MAEPVHIVGADRLVADFKRLGPKMRERLREAVYLAGADLQRYIKDEKLRGQVLKVRTGLLRNSISLDPPGAAKDDGKSISIMVGTNVSYGAAWELGTKDHEIRARRKKFLRFQTAEGIVFRKRVFWRTAVHHRPFLASGLVDMDGRIRARLVAAVRGSGGTTRG